MALRSSLGSLVPSAWRETISFSVLLLQNVLHVRLSFLVSIVGRIRLGGLPPLGFDWRESADYLGARQFSSHRCPPFSCSWNNCHYRSDSHRYTRILAKVASGLQRVWP